MKRALLLLFAALVLPPGLVVAAFYGYENVTGWLEWRRTESTLRAAGEELTPDALRPHPVPDAENMAAAPVFAELFTYYSPTRAPVSNVRLPPAVKGAAGEAELIALARRFDPGFTGDAAAAAQVVLAGLAPLQPVLDAVRDAAERPDAVWPERTRAGQPATESILSPLKSTSEVLAARATAAVAGGNAPHALADLRLITRLARTSQAPHGFPGAFAGQRMANWAVDIVAEGLDRNAWSDADLLVIEEELASLRPLEDFEEAVRGERAQFLSGSPLLEERARAIFTFVDFRSRTSEWLTSTLCWLAWELRPAGWRARDRAHYARLTQEWLGRVIHKGFVRPWAVQDWNARIGAVRRDHLALFRTPQSGLILPTIASAARNSAQTQARLDFARLACAIERHRRDTGGLPERLEDLAPRWLARVPRDVIGGGAYRYEVDGAAFALRSRGWNEKGWLWASR